MMLRFLAAAFLLVVPTVVNGHKHGHWLQPEDGSCVLKDDTAEVKTISLGKDKREVRFCIEKCMNNVDCIAMEFTEPKFCTLFFSELEKVSTFALTKLFSKF